MHAGAVAGPGQTRTRAAAALLESVLGVTEAGADERRITTQDTASQNGHRPAAAHDLRGLLGVVRQLIRCGHHPTGTVISLLRILPLGPIGSRSTSHIRRGYL